jgi:hypothetical protein
MGLQEMHRIEEADGPLGSGSLALTVRGKAYDLFEIGRALGLDAEDIRILDVHMLGNDRYAIRFFDLEERPIVAHEFDGEFRTLQEIRSHIADWMGDEAYHDFPWGVWCPAGF